MNLTIGKNMEKEFIELLNNIPDEILKLEGLYNIDPFNIADNYFGSDGISDISIDPNANVNGKSPVNFLSEIAKPSIKIWSYYIFWLNLKKRWGLEEANDIMKDVFSGLLYIHDLSKVFVPYCVAVDTSFLMIEGRPYGWLPSTRPKRLQSFMGQLREMTMDMSQENAGAIGLANALVNMAYYTKKEETSDKEIENEIQQTIHVFHNQFRVGGDSLRYDTPVLIRDVEDKTERYIKIGEFCEEQGIGALENNRYRVMSFNPVTGKTSFKPVYATIRHENPSKFMKVTLSTGQEIVVTDSHSLFTMDSDGLVRITEPKSQPKNLMIPINGIEDKKIIYEISKNNGRKKINYNIELTEETARFLGYYAADGNIDGSTIYLSLFNEEMENFSKTYLSSIIPEVTFRYKNGSLVCNVGREFADFIGDLCGRGAKNKRIPDQIISSSREVIGSFVSGYLEGDGDVDKNRICASSVSKELIMGINLLLLRLGVISTIRPKVKKKGTKYLSINDSIVNVNKSWRINIGAQYKDCFRFIHKQKEQKRTLLRGNNSYNYLDTDFLRPMIKNVYKQNIKLKSKGALQISYDRIKEIKQDLTKRLREIKINDNITYEQALELAEICMLPINCWGYYKKTRGWDRYSLRKGARFNSNKEAFIRAAKSQQDEMERLNRALDILESSVPVAVTKIEYLDDEKYSYDLSVRDNENFLSGDNIFAHNSPFTNFSLFDTPTLKSLFEDARYPDGSKVTDNIPEIMRVQKIYAEFFVKGSPKTGKPYRFPVTTVNIKTNGNGEIIDKEFFNYMADLNRERCVLNWHIGEKVASCCRMTSSLADLKNQIRMDSFGNGGISVGSHRVVTINLHRVALMSKDLALPFYAVLRNALSQAEKLLVVHKKDILQPLIDSGFLKFFRIGWLHPNMFFSTIGFTGLYDAMNVLENNILWEQPCLYIKEAAALLDTMEKFALEAGKRNEGFAFNIEEIPGENASPKLAAKDNFYYGTDLELLSNQMVPLYKDIDFFDRLAISGELMDRVSGGAILHLNIDDELTVGANRELLRRMIEYYRIPHFALNKGFSACKNGHTTVGVHNSCPECGGEIVTHISRVVGFFTDTEDWVKARREFEFNNRRWYKKEDILIEY